MTFFFMSEIVFLRISIVYEMNKRNYARISKLGIIRSTILKQLLLLVLTVLRAPQVPNTNFVKITFLGNFNEICLWKNVSF